MTPRQSTERRCDEVYAKNGKVHATGRLGEAIDRVNAIGAGTLDVGIAFAPGTPQHIQDFVNNAPNDLIHVVNVLRDLALDYNEMEWAGQILASAVEEHSRRRTWREVKLAAHRAGWRMVRDRSTVQQVWRVQRRDEDGFPDPDQGWAVVTFDPAVERWRWRIQFTGPGNKNTTTLADPTPAKVLTAAALVGLGMEQP